MKRAFIVAWIALALAGALKHTIAPGLFGRALDVLPHLRYGYVMFNDNPRRVPVFTYARADGLRHDLADLEPRLAFGYARARVALDAMFTTVYLRDLCNRALRGPGDTITIFADGYEDGRLVVTQQTECGAR